MQAFKLKDDNEAGPVDAGVGIDDRDALHRVMEKR